MYVDMQSSDEIILLSINPLKIIHFLPQRTDFI